MIIDILIFFVGLTILYFGAEFLVKGSVNTSVILGANPIVVGLTVVAFGTSLPELVVCLVAVLRGSENIALGNIIGSNIANIGLIMSLGALVYPLTMQKRTLRLDLPLMILFTGLLVVVSLDGVVGRMDGTGLFAGVILFTLYNVYGAYTGKAGGAEEVGDEVDDLLNKKSGLGRELARTAVGMVGVAGGSHLLVDSGSAIARAMGVSEMVIGLSIVAVGTSLPELATTAMAAFKKHSDIAVGNIIGSNIYNIGFVMGATTMVNPVPVAWKTVTGEMVIMTAFSVALVPVAARLRMGRGAGSLFLLGYTAFIGWMVVYRLG